MGDFFIPKLYNKSGDYMKRKLSLLIVVSGTLGILFNIANVLLENPSNPLLAGLGIFRYFTLLSNLLVVIYFWILFSLNKLDNKNSFKRWLGAVTVYITITFIVFFLFLQPTYTPVGFAKASSILCHYVTPVLTIGFMIYYQKDYKFNFKDILYWIVFPIVYVVFVLVYGGFTGDYFYPFLQLNYLGVTKFILNFIGLLVFFSFLSFGIVLLTKHKKTA